MIGFRSDVTIVISSFDQAAFLGEAIEGALRQSVPCRVVVVDDGSADGSVRIAEQLGVEVLRLAHRGALETFRSAVEQVETPFYCLLNGDDAIDPEYVESTRQPLNDPRIGFVYTGVQLVGAESGTIRAHPFDREALRWANYVHGASLARKAAYDAVGGFDRAFSGHHEDWALWVSMVDAGWLGVPVDRPLLRYRRHPKGSRNPTGRWEVERTRWRLAGKHPRFYGVHGVARLAASAAKLVLTGS